MFQLIKRLIEGISFAFERVGWKARDLILPFIQKVPPPAIKGKYIKIKYCTQLPTPTPTFAFFANLPQYIKEPYKRYIENKLRDSFDFSGVPIHIYFRKK